MIRAELLKLRTVRSNIALLVVTVVIGVGLGSLVCALAPLDELTGPGVGGGQSLRLSSADRLGAVLGGLGLAALLVGVIGVQIIGQEHRFKTIRVTFAAEPRRAVVLLAKLAALMATTVVTAVALVGLSVLVNGAILSGRGFAIGLSAGDYFSDPYLRILGGHVLLTMAYALAGFGVGLIVRQPIGAIIVVLVWPLIIETVLFGFLQKQVGRWLPYQAGNRLLVVEDSISEAVGDLRGVKLFAPWNGFLYFVGFAVGLCLIGWLLTERRDA